MLKLFAFNSNPLILVEENIQKTKADELKIFHKFLFGNPGKVS